MPWPEEKRLKSYASVAMGTPDLQLQTLPRFSGTVKIHGSPYMDQGFCYHTAESDKKWGLITLMIFFAALGWKKCIQKRLLDLTALLFHTSQAFASFPKNAIITLQCLRLLFSFKIMWKLSHVSGMAL